MTVSDMALQSRRWLQCSERLIAVSAAVGEAIAFHGLVAASVLPRETCAHLSRAYVPVSQRMGQSGLTLTTLLISAGCLDL